MVNPSILSFLLLLGNSKEQTLALSVEFVQYM